MKRLWRRIAYLVLLAGTGPAIAAQIEPPPLEAYGDLPAVEDMAISPSGKRFAAVARINGKRTLMVSGEGKKALTVAPIGDTKVRWIEWAGNDKLIIVTSATQGLGLGFTTDKIEFRGALILTVGRNDVEVVFKNRPSIANAIWGHYGTRLIDGEWKAYFSGLELKRTPSGRSYVFDHGRPTLYEVDLAENKPRRAAKPAGTSRRKDWLIDGSGRVAATLEISESGDWDITNISGARITEGVDPRGHVSLVSFGRDGSSVIYAVADQDSGFTRWFDAPLAGGSSKEIFAGVDIERTYIGRKDGRLLGYLQGGASPKPVFFDETRQSTAEKVFKAFPDLNVRIADWTPDFNHLLVFTSGNADSGTWYRVDMTEMKADPVGYARTVIHLEAVGKIATVKYQASDGLDLDGILTLPPDREARNLPVIMLPHGGPHSHDEERFDWWAQAFASRGYAVFQPNFRGSTNRDDAFRRAGYGQWGRKMQTDISDGLSELARRGIVDPDRACIMGASYGGYAALAGVTIQNDLYRCAVAVAPVSDLKDMYWTNYRESGRNRMLRRNFDESLGDRSTFDEVSPRKHAEKADAPIMLIHGKDDTVVPIKQSNAMASALKRAGKPYKLVVLKDEDHWLSRAETRKRMLEEAMRFVKKHNPPD